MGKTNMHEFAYGSMLVRPYRAGETVNQRVCSEYRSQGSNRAESPVTRPESADRFGCFEQTLLRSGQIRGSRRRTPSSELLLRSSVPVLSPEPIHAKPGLTD
ncbi:MAG: hypothetical protein M1335_03745 [Chloroflexi bacterium]|nr:hypothetical protein [Chloroflexota bacterium]